MSEVLVQYVEQVAEDYHRDFKHNENAKAASGTTWRECSAARCVRFRSALKNIPEAVAADTERALGKLRALHRTVDRVIRELEGSLTDD